MATDRRKSSLSIQYRRSSVLLYLANLGAEFRQKGTESLGIARDCVDGPLNFFDYKIQMGLGHARCNACDSDSQLSAACNPLRQRDSYCGHTTSLSIAVDAITILLRLQISQLQRKRGLKALWRDDTSMSRIA
jgi:hypothetical protein